MGKDNSNMENVRWNNGKRICNRIAFIFLQVNIFLQNENEGVRNGRFDYTLPY